MNKVIFYRTNEYLKKSLCNLISDKSVLFYSKKKSDIKDIKHLFYSCISYEDFKDINDYDFDKDICYMTFVILDSENITIRHDKRFLLLQRTLRPKSKIICSKFPYIINAWKFYYHYSFFDKSLLKYHHSYAFEQAKYNYDEGISNYDPYNILDLTCRTKDFTMIEYNKVFDFNINYIQYNVTNPELKEYERIRDCLFNSEKTIKPVLKKLQEYSSSLIPNHNLNLDLNLMYKNKSNLIIYHTDLNIDLYLKNQMSYLFNHSNELSEVLSK